MDSAYENHCPDSGHWFWQHVKEEELRERIVHPGQTQELLQRYSATVLYGLLMGVVAYNP